ncbi:hypothetical protein ACU8N7_33530 (plasmid) [Rhizobium leguminosarum]
MARSDFERFIDDLGKDVDLLEYVKKNVTGLASLGGERKGPWLRFHNR